MKLIKFAPKKKTAQAMVEFAIVLPILLLLLYGILEAGRLLFMYSTIVTASRQAVRYGSATGAGGDYTSIGGPNNSNVARYQDCYGIRLAANRVDYLNAFDHTGTDVLIQYDDGTTVTDTCNGNADPDVHPAGNSTRIVVTVTGHFHPIVRLVPFGDRKIEAKSARTILTSVSIVNSVPGITRPKITITDEPDYSELGQALPIVVKVEDETGSGIPTGTINISYNTIPIIGCQGLTLSAGTVTCPNIAFYSSGTITVDYTSDTAAYATTSESAEHVVHATPVTVTVEDNPNYSIPGESIAVRVTVRSIYDSAGTTIIPTGNVVITNGDGGTCTPTLINGGVWTCSMSFSNVGTWAIDATYISDDTDKYLSNSGSKNHLVGTDTPVPSNTPPPTNTPTQTPIPTATSTSTPAVTPVLGCNSIRDQFGANPITIYHKTMYLDIKNDNPYPVTMSSIFVRWNYNGGRIGGDGKLTLKTIDLNGTIFWTGSVNAPLLTIPLSPPVTLPANGASRITFTFDYTYGNPGGEELQIDFSTPGCEGDPIHVQNQ